MKKLIYLLAGGLILLTSCEKENSEDVNQDRIYTIYEFGYDESVGKTEATATFKFGNITGTILELTAPSNVTINSASMTEKTLPITYYFKDFSGINPSGSFKFEDTDGNVFNNVIPMAKTIDFTPPGTINKNNDYTLTWIGDAVAQHEHIKAVITSSSNTEIELFFEDGVGATGIVLNASQLSTIADGQYKLRLTRSYCPPLSSGTGAGGSIESYYTTLEKSITIQ